MRAIRSIAQRITSVRTGSRVVVEVRTGRHRDRLARCALLVIVAMIAGGTLPAIAHAGPSYVFDEEAGKAGTWREFSSPGKEVAKIHYDASEWEALRRRIGGAAVDAGATGQTGSV
jgi:hypothetical protein